MKLFKKELSFCTGCPNMQMDLNKTRLYCDLTKTHLCWIGEKQGEEDEEITYHDLPDVEEAIPIPPNCPLPNV